MAFLPRPPGPASGRGYQRTGNFMGSTNPGTLSNPFAAPVSGGRILDGMASMNNTVVPSFDPRSQYPSQVGTVQEFFSTALPAFVRKYIVRAGIQRSYPHFAILPPKEASEKQISGYAYAIVRFDQTLPTPTPEGTAPRLIKHSMEQHEFRHTRSGQAFRMSGDDLMTDHGRELFSNYVHTLASNSTIAAQITITATILRCQDVYRANRVDYNNKDATGDTGTGKIMTSLGYLSTVERGIYMLLDAVRETSQNSNMPRITHFLSTNTLFGILAFGDQKETEFYRKGPEAPRIEEEGGEYFERRGINGVHFVREPSYMFGRSGVEGNIPQNLLMRFVEVGRHYWLTKEHMLSTDLSIPFSRTNGLGFLNYSKGDGVVQVQPYSDLLHNAACWDDNGELWCEYATLVRDNGNELVNLATEAKLQRPSSTTGACVDPFIVWLPGSSPKVCSRVGEMDTKYFTIEDQKCTVKRAYQALRSQLDMSKLEDLKFLLAKVDEWFTPDYRYAEPFAFAIAAAYPSRPTCDVTNSFALKVGTKTVCKHYSAIVVAGGFDEELNIAEGLGGEARCSAKIFERFPTYFLSGKENYTQKAKAPVRVVKNHFPGFSTIPLILELLEWNDPDFISDNVRDKLANGIDQLKVLMGFLNRTFSCSTAKNYFFDDAVVGGKIDVHDLYADDSLFLMGCRSMLLGPRYQSVYLHSGAELNEADYAVDPYNQDKLADWAGDKDSTEEEKLYTGGTLKIDETGNNLNSAFTPFYLLFTRDFLMKAPEKKTSISHAMVTSVAILARIKACVAEYQTIYRKLTPFLVESSTSNITEFGVAVINVIKKIIAEKNFDYDQTAELTLLTHACIMKLSTAQNIDELNNAEVHVKDVLTTYEMLQNFDIFDQIKKLSGQADFRAEDNAAGHSDPKYGKFLLTRLAFSKRYFEKFGRHLSSLQLDSTEAATKRYKLASACPEALSNLRPTSVERPEEVNSDVTFGYFQTRFRAMRKSAQPFARDMLPDSSSSKFDSIYDAIVHASGLIGPHGQRVRGADRQENSRNNGNSYSRVFGEMDEDDSMDYPQKAIDYLNEDPEQLKRGGAAYLQSIGQLSNESKRRRLGVGGDESRCGAGLHPDVNSPFHIQRVQAFSRNNGSAEQILLHCLNLALCATRIHRDAFQAMAEADVPPPIGFLVVDMNIKLRMSAVVCMGLGNIPGSQGAGFLSYLLPDFSGAYDAENKMWTFTLTFSMAGVIFEPDRFLTFPEALHEGYYGGGDGRIMRTGYTDAMINMQVDSYLSMQNHDVDYNYKTREKKGSRFVFHVGYSGREGNLPEHINHAGSLLDKSYALAPWAPYGLTKGNRAGGLPAHDSAFVAMHRFGFHKQGRGQGIGLTDKSSYADTLDMYAEGNVLTSRAAQWTWCSGTGEYTFKKVVACGALERVSDPGCTAVLRGEKTVARLLRDRSIAVGA